MLSYNMKDKTDKGSPPLVSTGTGGSERRRGASKRSKRYPMAQEKVLPPRVRRKKSGEYSMVIE